MKLAKLMYEEISYALFSQERYLSRVQHSPLSFSPRNMQQLVKIVSIVTGLYFLTTDEEVRSLCQPITRYQCEEPNRRAGGSRREEVASRLGLAACNLCVVGREDRIGERARPDEEFRLSCLQYNIVAHRPNQVGNSRM